MTSRRLGTLEGANCDKVFKEKPRGGEIKHCHLLFHLPREYRTGANLLRVVSFKVVDDPSIDTRSRTGKLIMGILALIAEFENDIRRERQMDGIKKARERGTRFGRKPLLVPETIQQVRKLRKSGKTVPEIMRQTSLSKASVYRALSA